MAHNETAGHAAAARARALYGKRLTEKQYRELCTCRSVGEIVSYLKAQTGYKTVLADVKENAVHRGALEQLLRLKIAENLKKLYGYDKRIDAVVSMYHQQQIEVHWILRWLRAKTGDPDNTWFLSTATLAAESSLDPVRMNTCKTVGELAAELRDTPYAAVLSKFADDDRLPTVTALETALLRSADRSMQKKTDDAGAQITALLGSRLDVQNFCRIWRMKEFFGSSEEEIRDALLPSGGNFTETEMTAMIEAENAETVAQIFYTTRLGRQVPPAERKSIDTLEERIPYFEARHNIHFSADPAVICVAYAILAEIELHNLIHIVEGVRYALPTPEILKYLVLDEQKGG